RSPLVDRSSEIRMMSGGGGCEFRDLDQADYLPGYMAPRHSKNESTHQHSQLQSLGQIRMSLEKTRPLGLTKGLDFFQQLETNGESVERVSAPGGAQRDFPSEYFNETRKRGGIQTARINRICGGYERLMLEAALIRAAAAGEDVKSYLRGEETGAPTL